MTKSYITLYLESNIGEAVDRSATIWATVVGKGYISLVNGLIAVVVANLIYSSIAAALKSSICLFNKDIPFFWKHPPAIISRGCFMFVFANMIVTFAFW